MEIFLILLLAFFLFLLWRRLVDNENHRKAQTEALEERIDFLSAQIRALQQVHATVESSVAEPKPANTEVVEAVAFVTPAKVPTPVPDVAEPIPVAPEAELMSVVSLNVPPAVSPLVTPLPAQSPVVSEPLSHIEEPAQSAEEQAFSLEMALGTNWLNKLGIGIVILGVASFLAFKLQSWGPAGKVLCGYAVSLSMLLVGFWLERKVTYRIPARGALGGGWAMAFFTTFALYHVPAAHVLNSLVADLLLMLLVAAGMVAHSLRYRSQAVTGLAFLLGFATLITGYLDSASEMAVFSLIAGAVLALGLVIVTSVFHWSVLEIAGVVAVYLTHAIWLTEVLPADLTHFADYRPSVFIVVFYWLIFRLAYVLRTPRDEREENLSSLIAVLNSVGLLSLLKMQSAHPEWSFATLIALGVMEMAMAFLVRKRRRRAFVVLSTIAVVLMVAAVPFRFKGVSWTILWLVEAHVLMLCSLRLREAIFRRLGLIAGLLSGVVLALHDVVPIVLTRLTDAHSTASGMLIAACMLAALLNWILAEVYPRLWSWMMEDARERILLRVFGWMGTAAAATAIWLVLPVIWVPAAWLVLALLVSIAAERFIAPKMAAHTDVVATLAVAGAFFWLTDGSGWWAHGAPLSAVCVLLYVAAMNSARTSSAYGRTLVRVYSWTATLVLAYTACELSPSLAHGPLWMALGIAFFELGRRVPVAFLRWHGYFLVALAFADFLMAKLPGSSWTSAPANLFLPVQSLLVLVLVLLAGSFWLQERTRSIEDASVPEQTLVQLSQGMGTLSLVLWLAFRVPSEGVPVPHGEDWISVIWSVLALAFLALAWRCKRRFFLAQALVLSLFAVVRFLAWDLSEQTGSGWTAYLLTRAFAVALLMGSGLVYALRLRENTEWTDFPSASALLARVVRGAEQWLFFLPMGLLAIVFAVRLDSGEIVLAWSLQGLTGFLLALPLRQRAFRLGSLGLLLTSVGKFLLIDLWQLPLSQRYPVLILLGLVLVAVSFLYTRFSSTIRKFL